MNVSVYDYGVGNLHSLARAIGAAGARVRIERDARAASRADALVLPGVGAFAPAAARLAPAAAELRAAIDGGLPCLGICLGMQLFFDVSEEGGGRGIGVLPGRIRRLRAERIPHMGWNTARSVAGSRRAGLDGARSTRHGPFYFAHSFVAEPKDPACVAAWTEHDGEVFPAVVARERVWGMQFHPEKSGAAGLRLIRAFLAEATSASVSADTTGMAAVADVSGDGNERPDRGKDGGP